MIIPKAIVGSVLSWCCAMSVVSGQTVTIRSDGLTGDGESILLNTMLGSDGSDHKFLTIINRCPFDIRYKVHIHDLVGDSVRFHGADGTDGDFQAPFYGVLNANDDQRDVFPVYIRKRLGKPGVYHDRIGVEAWDGKSGQRLGYAEVPVLAVFYPKSTSARRPKGYQMSEVFPGSLSRVPQTVLPLSVHSNHEAVSSMTGDQRRSCDRIVRRALDVWNQAARAAHLSSFFRYVTSQSVADFSIDWSGDGLAGNALGVAILIQGNPAIIGGVIMRSPTRQRPEAMVAEDLLQELGHVLGLGHSDDPRDMMGPHNHPPSKYLGHEPLEFVELTERDLAAVAWLFDQDRFLPIIPRRSIGP